MLGIVLAAYCVSGALGDEPSGHTLRSNKSFLLHENIMTFKPHIIHPAVDVLANHTRVKGANLGLQNIRVHYFPDEFFAVNGTTKSGFLVDILNILTKVTGSTFTITSRPDLAHGRQNDDGSWNGTLIGSLINDEADLVGPGMTMTSHGERLIDYTVPILPYKLYLVYNPVFGFTNQTQYITMDNENYIYLNTSKNITHREIYQRIKAQGPLAFVSSNEEGITKVLDGNAAYIASEPFVRQAVVSKGLQIATEEIGKFFSFAFAVQKGSKLRRQLNIQLLRLLEDGTMSMLLDKYHLAVPIVVLLR